jgi:hypothetical protein
LPNFLHIDSIGQILNAVSENYAKEHIKNKQKWVINAGIWNKMTLEELKDAAKHSTIKSNLSLNLRIFRLENHAALHATS